MLQKAKPFISLLFSRRVAGSRYAILKTLVALALLKRTRKNAKDVTVKMNGFIIHAPDYCTLSLLIKEKFVHNEYFFPSETDRPVIIDAGAHIGISLIYFRSLYPAATVHCFEPSSDMFRYLEKNMMANKMENVILHRKAVARNEGVAKLAIPGNGANINYRLTDDEASEDVQTIRLSAYMQNLPQIDLLKMDIEGAEREVLRDLDAVLQTPKISRMIFELHGTSLPGDREIFQMLAARGYSVSTVPVYEDLIVTASKK